MTGSRDPEEVLASIRRLVAREVQNQQAREKAERPDRGDLPVVSQKASAAARRLVLGAGERVAANGTIAPAPGRSGAADWARIDAEAPAAPAAEDAEEARLRALIRDILREEVRTRMGPRINENIRRILREELQSLLSEARPAPDDAPSEGRD
ncbi:hypothetical protein [Mangrovicoccus algicola]|uniref:DUF2497 domain-containing protein n=1 Tax=Mangrovicoccus algicola TaxID=2771008 RepID=A0A8J7CVT1_9RHOB|nr:hypothetical protein [Mangrovicoccus algicola]MBE3639104.1 hypothetical protein [Mangrovicoccus algicola]